MAKKEIVEQFKIQAPGGQATPAPPLGPVLGAKGVNPGQFIQQFNAATGNLNGKVVACVVTVFNDRSFSLEIKSSPAAVLIKEAAGIDKGSGEPHAEKVGVDHEGPSPEDRRGEDGGPEQRVGRVGDARDRGNGAVDGRDGGGLSDGDDQACQGERVAGPDDRAGAGRGDQGAQEVQGPEVRPDGRGVHAPWDRHQAGGPADPRVGLAAQGDRQVQAGRGVLPRRSEAGVPGRRGGEGRGRGPGRRDREGGGWSSTWRWPRRT